MGQSNQLVSRGRDGDNTVPQNAVQEPLFAVLGSVGPIYVQRLEHRIRKLL